ncbi:MAG: PEP-CTERM system TPR-repeat protein PrsT [Gallionella sp.]|nr:PEP-CTERM system TPR-repeat protein PrsT [Gallionella sp.]MDD5612096.1 PEP-CTERM system TPR-repeat protein PrsT [Gallionella sp.]
MSKIGPQRKATLTLLVASLLMGGVTACNKFQSAESLIDEARQYQTKGDQPAAIIQLKNALQKSPDNADARFLLGTIYNKVGDSASAEKELRWALKLGYAADKVLPELSVAFLAQEHWQEVIDETQKLDAKLLTPELLTLRGNAFLGLNKGAEAQAAFEQALKVSPGFPGALLGLSRYALFTKNVEQATILADQAIQQNPQNTDVWLFKGDLKRSQGKNDEAIAAYQQILKFQPGNVGALVNLAIMQISDGKFIEAKANIDAARKAGPKNLIVFYAQALLDSRQDRPAAALESIQKILSAAPDHMPTVLLAGTVQIALGSYPQAEQHLRKYLTKYPGNIFATKLLATVMLRTAQIPAAIAMMNQSLETAPEDIQLLTLLGDAYMQSGDYVHATEVLGKASALSPKEGELHTALGMSKLAQGENERAIAELELGAKLNTRTPQSAVMLGMTQLRLKQYDKALATASAIEKTEPNNVIAQNMKGAAYLGKNDLANARTSYEKSLTLDPLNLAAAESLTQMDMQAKHPEATKKRFETMLGKDKKNIQVMTALSNLALLQGNTAESTRWLEQASKENPDLLLPSLQLITHYLRIGENKQALDLAQKLQGTNSGNAEFLDLLALAQYANNDKNAALETYAKVAAARPQSGAVQMRIARIQLDLKNNNAARDALIKAVSAQPDLLEAQLALATLESSLGNFDKALSIADRMQRKSPKSPVGFELQGNVLMQQKKFDQAASVFEHTLTLAPSGLVMTKLHTSLVSAGKKAVADIRLARWMKDHPDDIATRLYQAALDTEANQLQAAAEHYQVVLRQFPNHIVALNNLAWVYQELKDKRASELAEKAYKLEPENPAVLDTLGWLLLEQGDTKRATELLKKATTIAPQAAEMHYHLAQALLKAGDKEQARKELEQVLATGKNYPKLEEARVLLKQL